MKSGKLTDMKSI